MKRKKIGLVAPPDLGTEVKPPCVDWLTNYESALIRMVGLQMCPNGSLEPVKDVDPIKNPPALPYEPGDGSTGTGNGDGSPQTPGEPGSGSGAMDFIKKNGVLIAAGLVGLVLLTKKRRR